MNPILEKVKKLLALANDKGATEGERDNALRMAHGMLAKHNLDMSDLHRHVQHHGRTNRGSVLDFRVWLKNKHFL
jgi:hypothetical protein